MVLHLALFIWLCLFGCVYLALCIWLCLFGSVYLVMFICRPPMLVYASVREGDPSTIAPIDLILLTQEGVYRWVGHLPR